jgi:hypothetical protein
MLEDPDSLAPIYKQDDERPLEPWLPPNPTSIPNHSQVQTPTQQPNVDASYVSVEGLRKVLHPSPSLSIPGGRNLLQEVNNSDQFAHIRATQADVHYPFASHTEWGLAKWLAHTPLPQSEINKFLKLPYVRTLPDNFFYLLIVILDQGTTTILQIIKRSG